MAAVGLLGSGLVGTAHAKPPASTTVTGTVKTAAGGAVAGVKVNIKVGTNTAVSVTTSSTGAFSATVRTGTATVDLTSPTAPASGLPQVWAIKNVGTSIVNNGVLTFTLPAASPEIARVQRANVGVAGVRVAQCSASTSTADAAVVLPGSAAVAPTQDFTGAVTSASGDVTINSFRDTTFGRLCGPYAQTVGGATTDFLARSGVKDTAAISGITLFAPPTVPQAGVVKDNLGNAKAGLKVAFRSAGGQVDSTSAPTSSAGAYSCQVASGNVFARFTSRSLSNTVAPPTNIPRSFKATIDGTATGTTAWNVNLPATVRLDVKVVNADGTPVENAVVRPITTGAYDAANSATLVSGQPAALITQQIFSDGLSNNLGITSVRLFADSSLGSFTVTKNIGGGLSRTTTVAAGTALTSNKTITVVLPAA
ncbi:MAG: hypothetical protein ABI862_20935 [Ilumatobacteraceae bacterium]